MNAAVETAQPPRSAGALPVADAFRRYRGEILRGLAAVYGAQAEEREESIHRNAYYYGRLRELLGFMVEEGKRVLCLRSDIGEFLEYVRPTYGVGVEIAPELIEVSRRRCPQYSFLLGVPEDQTYQEKFDYILIINAVNDQFDVQRTLQNLNSACSPQTRVILTFNNWLWQPILILAEALGWKRPQPRQNWLSAESVEALLELAGFQVVKRWSGVLCPIYVPFVSWLLNDVIGKLPLLDRLGFVQAYVARPEPKQQVMRVSPSVSVVIPCRNEKGNIEATVLRMPEMGAWTELIFCDDRSTDGTLEEIRRVQQAYPERKIRLVRGPGISKAENVWTGFDSAQGDILMILDGDLAVPPEELPSFYDALVSGRGEFINGSRLVYPIRTLAMRTANVIGNKLFSLLFSHILREEIQDTLCGTKVLYARDYARIKKLRGSWGVRDRWGDYELIFGAAKLNLKYLELPVHYMERHYGQTKMTGRLRNAAIMLRMCAAAYRCFR